MTLSISSHYILMTDQDLKTMEREVGYETIVSSIVMKGQRHQAQAHCSGCNKRLADVNSKGNFHGQIKCSRCGRICEK